jgi:hypothetical protein
MTELLNKYKQTHDEFIDALVKYHALHLSFLERQSPRRTGDLRRVLKQMRIAVKELEIISQARMKERRIEWAEKHGLHNKETD